MKSLTELLNGVDTSRDYYSNGFRSLVEDHLTHIADNETREIDIKTAHKYACDFYGLLTELSIPSYLHWIYLRCNNLSAPFEYDGITCTIIVPDIATINRLLKIYRL